jgi:hypothetical protein
MEMLDHATSKPTCRAEAFVKAEEILSREIH